MTQNELKILSSLKIKKYREKYSMFLIEGFHLVEECLKSEKYEILTILLNESFDKTKFEIIAGFLVNSKVKIDYLDDKSFTKIIETQNSQGIAAVVKKPEHTVNIPDNIFLIIAVDKISDPGNLGTIIRTCHWFGVDLLLLSKNSADLYNSKVLRSSQGSIFHINIIDELELNEILKDLSEKNFSVYVTDLNSSDNLNDVHFENKSVIVFGNESRGVSNLLINNSKNFKIKSFANCDSLNVAVSTGIILNHYKNK